MTCRTYELSNLPGKPAPYRTKADLRALVGKRIAYDLRGSSYTHHGVVTDAGTRELEISHSWINTSHIEQLNVVEAA